MYKKELILKENESPAIINKETGEVREVLYNNNIPENSEIFEKKASFRKDYSNSWKFLNRELSSLEYKAAHSLAMLAKANTNSLEPINDDTALKDLSIALDVSINKISQVLKVLWDYGVYGKFEVNKVDEPYKKYWIVNPYLSFSGQVIRSDVRHLFQGTHIAKAFNDPLYRYKKQQI